MLIKILPRFLLSLLLFCSLSVQAADLLNLSTKSFVGTNDQRQVAGFVITGTGMVRVAIKAEAPSLKDLIPNTLSDPKLTLKNALTGDIVAVNDNWADGDVDLLLSSQNIPNHELEAAIVVDLPAGNWTAMVEGVEGGTGVALVSVKEISVINSEANLLNLSTKSFVGVNEQRQVAGIVVVGEGTVRVLIKAIAPSLQGVQGLLTDPQLTLKNALTGEVIRINDDWQSGSTASDVSATGSAPLNSKEAAMVVDLAAGNWTAMVEGVSNTTGVALVSVTKLSTTNAPTIDNPPLLDSSFWLQISKDLTEKTYAVDSFLYRSIPVPSRCIAGETSHQAKQRALRVFNEIRQLHHLAAIAYSNATDQEVQEAALVQKANNALTHTPPSSYNCYSQLAFDGSSNSNLHAGSAQTDPAADLIGYIDDANNISILAKVGHRRAMLNPFLGLTSYGQVQGSSALKVYDFTEEVSIRSSSIPDYVAFPFGAYPYLFFSDRKSDKPTPWSLSIIEDKTSIWANQFDYFNNAAVSVTHKDSGQSLAISHLFFDNDGIGVPNNLSWQVADWQYDTWYSVHITNIQMQSGQTKTIRYDVFIDYSDLIDISADLEAGDQLSGTVIGETFYTMIGALPDNTDKDSYEIELPSGSMDFFGDSTQFSNMAFYISVYGEDKQLIASFDEPTTLNLSRGKHTIVVSQCNDNNSRCYSASINYSVTAQ